LKRFVLISKFEDVFAHFVDLSFTFLEGKLGLCVCFAGRLSFASSSFHLLHQLSKLSVFFVLLLKLRNHALVFLLQLVNHKVSLLELLLNNFKFLRIGKCILRLNNLFQVAAQADALVHIGFNFELCFVGPGIFNIAFQQFNLVIFNLQLEVLLSYFSF